METASRPSVAVIGAGAIGAVVAAAAADAGHRPVVCVRRPISSLVVEADHRSRPLPVDLISDPGAAARVDWVLLATKAQDTAGAAPWLHRLCGPDTVVVALQNGIDHVERLAPHVDHATVLPALVYVASERVGPGRVVHHSGKTVIVAATPTGDRFADLLRGGGLEIVTSDDFVTDEWRKLLSNVVANPVTALTLRRLDVIGDPGIEDLARRILGEAVDVARAEGANLGPEDIDAIFERYRGYTSEGSSGSSMYYDRLAGRPLEHQELTGALVRAAYRHGIPTPFNDAILALLGALDRGQASAPAPAPGTVGRS